MFLLIFKIGPSHVFGTDVLQRKHYTLESCAKACLEEKEIHCKYFKFVNATGTCFLSSKNQADFSTSGMYAFLSLLVLFVIIWIISKIFCR